MKKCLKNVVILQKGISIMDTFLSLYNEIEYTIKQGTLCLNEYKSKIEELQNENQSLKKEISELIDKLNVLQEKYKLLTITKTVINKEDKKETKKKINDLVREIDICIELLNK